METSAFIPDEEHAAAAERHPALVARLSRMSVHKRFEAYRDVDWDAPEHRIDPEDPRFEIGDYHPLGGTAWYRALPPGERARLGLRVVAGFMKVGVHFENVLTRGLLAFAVHLPNRSPEFRYAYHEAIEECQHSLMFQEFLNRTGFEVPPIAGWRARAGERVVSLARTFPPLFFVFVLGGEDPIDHLQRTALASERPLHPLLRRISQIHVTEEARHLCFARSYLREEVPRLSPRARAFLTAAAPVVLSRMAATMLEPSAALCRAFAVPEPVIDEAYRKNPRHRQAVVDSLAKVRGLADELGLVPPAARAVWRGLGIA